jgi:CO dehydrogenase/acetyl-CoA synthase beta subunit
MELVHQSLDQLHALLEREEKQGCLTSSNYSQDFSWPVGGENNFVFKQEIGVELGSPKKESVSFVFHTEKTEKIRNGRISIIGPELHECNEDKLDFGQIIMVGIQRKNPASDYHLFQKLEEIKYKVDLKGYMRRGVSQFLREWSRIGKSALDSGFNLRTLGQALIREYGNLPLVTSVEILLTTESRIVRELKPIAGKVMRLLQAAHKMEDDDLMDCDTCEYADLCQESDDLKNIREKELLNRSTP